MITLLCQTCSKPFQVKPYRAKTAKYCSRTCQGCEKQETYQPCEVCRTPFRVVKYMNKRRTCSVECKAVLQSQEHGDRIRHSNPIVCANCRTVFQVANCYASRRRCCSKECNSIWQSKLMRGRCGGRYLPKGEKHPLWNNGISAHSYRQHLKTSCERCGSTTELQIHHKDRNHANTDTSNLETICNTCHSKEHGGKPIPAPS
jgi:hypothetical protein